jgi:hypothetical protein
MNRTLIVIVLLVFATTGATADEIYVPKDLPGTAGCNLFPFHPTFGDFRYQLVIPAGLLGGKAALITDVAFAPCQASTLTATRFEMTMSHTTLTTPSATFALNLPNPQVVIPAGPLTWPRAANAWSPLGMARTFAYNGIDALTIEVRYSGGNIIGSGQASDTQTSSARLNYYRVYAYGTGAYSTPTGGNPDPKGALMVRLTATTVSLTGSGSPSIGGVVNLVLMALNDSGLPYQVGTSLGTGPIPLGKRQLNLSLDTFLLVSVQGLLPTVFRRYTGLLNSGGMGSADMAIPNDASLIGLRLHTAFLTLKAGEPFNISSISNTFTFSVIR